ncbi:MAG TPA: hypothetical protein DCX07_15185 [Phycisphaerales bacterium]|nr:hypothetical protein [Phycisphaerales bacterium]
MANVTYDGRSFLIDGERIWLASGSIHYFRVPAALWRDRLVKARNAGLNCISTYVAWNYHEMREGQWDFSGNRDIAAFVRMAGELGLYVILRPGPYICAEWDFGGLPAWLTTKTGIAYRTSNAAFMHYFDKYFRQVLPRLADLQVTRGGNIVAIQNENEYRMTTMPDRANYLTFISQLFTRAGFDVPVLTCNFLTEPRVENAVECANVWDGAVPQLKKLRLAQPDKPLLVTEFWDGGFDRWGGQHQTKPPRETARRAMEILGCGAQYNAYMWHGGTNFEFWGSRLCTGADRYQTTSYDYDAPLAEGGELTEKYYLTRMVNMLARHMGKFLATMEMSPPAVSVHSGTSVLNLSGPTGRLAVVTNNGCDDIATVRISLHDGRELTVPLAPLGAAAVFSDLKLTANDRLDYANLTPLGFFGNRLLVLHGPAGFEATFSLNGAKVSAPVPAGDEPRLVEMGGLTVALINSDLAQRTWLVDEQLLLGPVSVGETLEDEPAVLRGAKQYAVLPLDGKLTHRKVKPPSATKPTVPKLSNWTRLAVCTEPVATDLSWEKLDRPKDVDRLGIHYGYVWYRAEIDEERPRSRSLFLPECDDRATIYLNGSLLGTWGRGDGATRSPISASFRRGRNVLTMLVDNLGRFNGGTVLGELKGLRGPIYDAKLLRTRKFKVRKMDDFSRRIVPRAMTHILPQLEGAPVHSAELSIPLTRVTPLHLSFQDLPHHAAVLCNERPVGFFARHGGGNFADVTLGPELKKGRNVLRLVLWGDVSTKSLDKVTFHILGENLTEHAAWGFRPWVVPQPGGHVVGKDQPAWYVCSFKAPHRDRPLYLHIVGAKKGQLFLNGVNLGRFWTVGPQQSWLLPECWLKDENELMVFEEQGNIPSRSRLEIRPQGPFQS